MADLLGRRRMLLTGLTVFSSASLLAGVAGSAGLLIGARPLQGASGAALLPPAALSILAVNFAEALGAVTAAIASPGAPRRRPSSSRRPPVSLVTEPTEASDWDAA
jgi:MFS family permease